MTRLIAVGACYLDTIVTVPHFPLEDSKLRASTLAHRRGGNCPNTLEVLAQLLDATSINSDVIKLDLCCAMPAKDSAATAQIRASLGPRVGMDLCIYRPNTRDAPSSFVIQSQASGSRTIVNHNALAEMDLLEFESAIESHVAVDETVWVHFEGRNTAVARECIGYLRGKGFADLTVSVEIEKPGRAGLEEMAREADVVIYSRSWALGEGFASAEECLRSQSAAANKARLLICTWGAEGSVCLDRSGSSLLKQAAYYVPGAHVVDTNGAGDTFTAGLFYMQMCESSKWSINSQLNFANELAGRKIVQDGFDHLGEAMKKSWDL